MYWLKADGRSATTDYFRIGRLASALQCKVLNVQFEINCPKGKRYIVIGVQNDTESEGLRRELC